MSHGRLGSSGRRFFWFFKSRVCRRSFGCGVLIRRFVSLPLMREAIAFLVGMLSWHSVMISVAVAFNDIAFSLTIIFIMLRFVVSTTRWQPLQFFNQRFKVAFTSESTTRTVADSASYNYCTQQPVTTLTLILAKPRQESITSVCTVFVDPELNTQRIDSCSRVNFLAISKYS